MPTSARDAPLADGPGTSPEAGGDERLEQALGARGLRLLVPGLAHDVNGPLNTMKLQLALLGEKLADGPTAGLATGHLATLGEQVARIQRVVRRFQELVDPSAALGGLDLGPLVGDLGAFLTGEAQRRGFQLEVEPSTGPARTGAPPERVTTLVLGLLTLVLLAVPSGARVSLAVEGGAEWSTLVVACAVDGAGLDLGRGFELVSRAAAALGGGLERSGEGGKDRVVLRLPRGHH